MCWHVSPCFVLSVSTYQLCVKTPRNWSGSRSLVQGALGTDRNQNISLSFGRFSAAEALFVNLIKLLHKFVKSSYETSNPGQQRNMIDFITRVVIRFLYRTIEISLRSNTKVRAHDEWKCMRAVNQHQLRPQLNSLMRSVENIPRCANRAYTPKTCWHESTEHIQSHYSASACCAKAWFSRSRE